MVIVSKEEYRRSIIDYFKCLDYSNNNFTIVGKLIEIFSKGKILIIGDIHGDKESLDIILESVDIFRFLKNRENLLVSLGDLVDRGESGVEVIYTLTKLGSEYPDQVIILRGNHEVSFPNEVFPFDFDEELNKKYNIYGRDLLKFTIENFFKKLPLAAYIKGQIFFVHGGIPIQIPSLDEIANTDPESDIGYQLRWNDPTESIETYIESNRGPGVYLFGPKITEKFLKNNNLKKIVRSHEVPYDNGYKINHDGKVITIFSTKRVYNLRKASYAIYDSKEKKLEIKVF